MAPRRFVWSENRRISSYPGDFSAVGRFLLVRVAYILWSLYFRPCITLWSFDLAMKRWERVKISSKVQPQTRRNCGLRSSVSKQTLYLFGGSAHNGRLLNDLWSYDIPKHAWSELTPGPLDSAPVPRQHIRKS